MRLEPPTVSRHASGAGRMSRLVMTGDVPRSGIPRGGNIVLLLCCNRRLQLGRWLSVMKEIVGTAARLMPSAFSDTADGAAPPTGPATPAGPFAPRLTQVAAVKLGRPEMLQRMGTRQRGVQPPPQPPFRGA